MLLSYCCFDLKSSIGNLLRQVLLMVNNYLEGYMCRHRKLYAA